MTLSLYAFDMLSGRRLTPLPVTQASWKVATNTDEDISCTIPAKDPAVRKLRIWEQSALAVNGLLAVVDGVPVAAGPIWKRKYTPGSNTIDLTAGGLRSYFERRLILPQTARGASLVDSAGVAIPAFDQVVANTDLGGIIQTFVQLVRLWPGGSIPMIFPALNNGTRTDTVKAMSLKTLGSYISDVSGRQNGPDVEFRARLGADGASVLWEFRAGTETNPRLGQTDPDAVKFRYGASHGSATSDLVVSEDGTALSSDTWATGGTGGESALVAESFDPTLINAGYPLLQYADTGHTDATDPATVAGYAKQDTALGRYASSFWSLTARARQMGAPSLANGDYWLGDIATVTIDKSDPVYGGTKDYSVKRRIAAISGDQDDHSYPITFAEDVVAV